MLVQIWTNKFWTFQHVKDTLLTKNDDVISVAKYQFLSRYSRNCSVGARSVFLTQNMCFNSINIFRSTRCARHTNTMPFRLSADPVVSTFAINRFNDAMNIFLRKFMQNTCWLRNVNLVLKLWSNSNHLCWKSFCRLLKMSWRHNYYCVAEASFTCWKVRNLIVQF